MTRELIEKKVSLRTTTLETPDCSAIFYQEVVVTAMFQVKLIT
ncbi:MULTISPECIES: hypothetical protein [unclassified Nostoc]|nr:MULTISPECIES: hypothetical protein [unclassified Nostoc]